AIPSIDHPAVSALSRLRDRNVTSPRPHLPTLLGRSARARSLPGRGPSPPHLVGRSARARSAPAGSGDPHLPTLWGGRLGREAPLPGRGTLTSPPCGEVGSGATRPCRVGAPTCPYPPAELASAGSRSTRTGCGPSSPGIAGRRSARALCR